MIYIRRPSVRPSPDEGPVGIHGRRDDHDDIVRDTLYPIIVTGPFVPKPGLFEKIASLVSFCPFLVAIE